MAPLGLVQVKPGSLPWHSPRTGGGAYVRCICEEVKPKGQRSGAPPTKKEGCGHVFQHRWWFVFGTGTIATYFTLRSQGQMSLLAWVEGKGYLRNPDLICPSVHPCFAPSISFQSWFMLILGLGSHVPFPVHPV